jgi:hypothetical protein
MGGRRYRVVKRLPWIEGGRPVLSEGEWKWEGGETVVYEPGDTVYVDDRELPGIYHQLEAIDEAGRAALEELCVKAEAPAEITPVADLTPSDVEFLTHALEEKRRAFGPHEVVQDFAVLRDGSKVLLSTQYVPTNPLPDVVYGDNGLPDFWATVLRRKRREKERKHREMESKHARIRRGGSLGGRRGRETKRDKAARADEALLVAVRAYRAKHPRDGRPAIAAALVDKHGRKIDHADPADWKRAVAALTKRIERLEKSLDT